MTRNRERILCADTESLSHPELLGLDDERLDSQTWLRQFADAQNARSYVRSAQGNPEVWVAGSDDMEAINLAAALKRDRSDIEVNLVSFAPSGSLYSRARAAGLGEVMDRTAFLNRYKIGKSLNVVIDAAPGRFVSPGQADETRSACASYAQPAFPVNAAASEQTLPASAADLPSATRTPGSAALRAQGNHAGSNRDEARIFASSRAASAGKHAMAPALQPDAPFGAAAATAVMEPVPGPSASREQMRSGPVGPQAPAASYDSGRGVCGSVARGCGEAAAACGMGRRPARNGRKNCYVLVVVGAGGGVGKSTLAALISCAAHQRGFKTALVDADLQLGDTAHLLGCETPLRADDVAEAPQRLLSASCVGDLPAVIAPPLRMERSEFAASQMTGILSALRESFDVAVVNTPVSWNDLQVELMEAGTNVLFVLDQRPSSIRACKHMLDLCSRCGLASQPFLFAINRCSRKALLSAVDVSCALQGVHAFELAEGGRVVEELMGAGQASELAASKNPLALSVGALLDEILPALQGRQPQAEPPEGRRRRSFGLRRRGK